ncbi:MAG: cation:proton antiporter [Gemmatimonadaceae bacterium]|jgi:multicomponent Na+:H+ antiporter subunit B|nr:cation:proton antiporter [Gemmatimonadaceae bacterium]
MIELIDLSLLLFLAVIAVTVARLHNLFAVVLVMGFYSLVCAALFTVLDAVDVAFTEAAVGAGISTVVMLGTLLLTTSEEKPQPFRVVPLVVVLVTGAMLIFATLDMPHYGDPEAPIHQHVAPRYIQDSRREVGVPNIVTSVLASYRGFDTLGETTVIFAAGIGVLLMIGQALRFRDSGKDGDA